MFVNLLQKTKMPLFKSDSKSGDKKKKKDKDKNSSAADGDAINIGTPYMVQHNFHVGFDKMTGEFQGLPAAWHLLLSGSNIT